MLKVDTILNPFGKGQSVFAYKTYIDNLKGRYYQNIKDLVEMRVTKIKETYYIHVKIPSESNEKYPDNLVYYDVLLEFIPASPSMTTNLDNIRDYDLRVFSNDPAFMFTFNYAYHLRGHLIRTIPQTYYSKEAMKKPAITKNPYDIIGSSKVLWFAIYFLQENRYFFKDKIENINTKENISVFVNKIATQQKKLEEVQYRIKITAMRAKAERDKKKKEIALQREKEEKEYEKKRNSISTNEQNKNGMNSSLNTDNLRAHLNSSLESKNKSSLRDTNKLKSHLKSSLSK